MEMESFAYIDCGLLESSYVDPDTNLTYVSDSGFIDTGVVANISSDVIDESTPKREWSLRYFPMASGVRNCYTIRSLTAGLNYLVSAGFNYGNYDGNKNFPSFDVYIGVNIWHTVTGSYDRPVDESEIIVTANATYLEVCLVDTGKGTPFISWIQLRQLKKGMYPDVVGTTQALILYGRYNCGSPSTLRYPVDRYDGQWKGSPDPSNISTDSTVAVNMEYETPSPVMQTAWTTSSPKVPLYISLPPAPSNFSAYCIVLHFAEIQNTSKNELRQFDIYQADLISTIIPAWLSSASVHYEPPTFLTDYYNISLTATSNSTLPPLLNAYELFTVRGFGLPTYPQHVEAMNDIKEHYNITTVGWIGDPCLPSICVWPGIKCNASLPDVANYSSITNLSLSSSGLTGPVIDSFGNLSDLVSLNLSFNNLSGSLPNSLDLLTNLAHLDITGNINLSIILPPKPQRKYAEKELSYSFSNETSPSPSPSSNKKVKISIAVGVSLLVIAVAVVAVLWLKKRKYYGIGSTWENIELEGFSKLESRQFSHNDLKKITNAFKNTIGTGGFGSVYLGALKDGIQVAVKMHSNSSSQGLKELLTEAESLTRVHHKNLVSLMGYCIDKTCMALVYEYMPEGNLHDKLKGLEYLHKACNPPLIHRDVKTSNILLSATLEAKIADFGLSRTFSSIAVTHVSTRIVGTPGYLDPEYYLSNGQLTVKSDVFSFGVVLLEIVTGRPPITIDEGGNLVQWVRQKLSGGDIQSIIDARMHGEYDINSVWKVTNLACKCTELTSAQRPTMTEVAAELKECLDLEITITIKEMNMHNPISDLSQDTDFEIAYLGSMPAPSPSVR